MEITIKIHGRDVSVEVSGDIAEWHDQAKHKAENLYHEKRRHWDDREFDEYIVATEGLLPYQPTVEDIICQRDELARLLSILDTCTEIQQERFLLYALYDFSYAEIAEMDGCTKAAVHYSIEAVRKKFLKFFKNPLNDWPR